MHTNYSSYKQTMHALAIPQSDFITLLVHFHTHVNPHACIATHMPSNMHAFPNASVFRSSISEICVFTCMHFHMHVFSHATF